MRHYNKRHLWLEYQNDIAFLGLTVYAISALQKITFLEFSRKSQAAAGDMLAVLESIKIAWEIQAPFAIKQIEYNPELENDPSILNLDPEGKGWLCRFQITKINTVEWMDAETYQNFIKGIT